MPTVWNKRFLELKAKKYIEKQKQIIGIDNIARKYFGKSKIKNIKMQPYTIVNLLGKYGNFEEDSNDDGLADWWSYSKVDMKSLVTGLFGSKAQQLYTDNSANDKTGTQYIWMPFKNVNEGDILFAKAYYRKGSNTTNPNNPYITINFRDSNLSIISGISKSASEWSEFWNVIYGTFNNAPAGTYDCQMVLNVYLTDGVIEEMIWDGIMVVNLTAMGALPSGLQAYFNNAVTNWEDLATTSNITAIDGREQTGEDWLAELLPYVDSVASLGYQWGE